MIFGWRSGVLRALALLGAAALTVGAVRDKAAIHDCRECPPLRIVPAGTFEMLVPLGRVSGPPGATPVPVPVARKIVTIPRAFAIGVTEVTVAQYRAFTKATGREDASRCFVFQTIQANGRPVFGWRTGAGWQAPGYPQQADSPVSCIRWIDAQAYAEWLSSRTAKHYRLPSEAEWEFAARGGAGDEPAPATACMIGNGADRTFKRAYPGLKAFEDCDDGALFARPVGGYSPNRLGLYDMHGNLWEWVADCDHANYAAMPVDGRAWIADGDCAVRGRRGGSWYRASGDDRSGLPTNDAHGNAGFRVVREIG